jgi:hypothetical protein
MSFEQALHPSLKEPSPSFSSVHALILLLDDIASVLDDVAALTKVATKKTAGVLGDDLALNAEQMTGLSADHELPIIWKVAKRSFWNKVFFGAVLSSLKRVSSSVDHPASDARWSLSVL